MGRVDLDYLAARREWPPRHPQIPPVGAYLVALHVRINGRSVLDWTAASGKEFPKWPRVSTPTPRPTALHAKRTPAPDFTGWRVPNPSPPATPVAPATTEERP